MKNFKILIEKVYFLKKINKKFKFFQTGKSLIIKSKTRNNDAVVWLKLNKRKFELLFSNFYRLTFISAYKITKENYFVGTNINGTESLRFLEINNLEMGDSLIWQQVIQNNEIVIFNEKFPELSGYAYNFWGNSFDLLKKRAIFEYYERISATNIDHIKAIKKIPLHSQVIGYDQLGILWGTNHIPKVNDWVKAYSERYGCPVYIPFNFIFYGRPVKGKDAYLGSSNGMAIGSSYQDSVHRALSEFIERDVLIEAWLEQGINLVRLTSVSQILGKSFQKLCSLMRVNANFFLYKDLIDNKYIVWCLVKTRNKAFFSSSGFCANENLKSCLTHSFDEAIGALISNKKETRKRSGSVLDKIQNYYFDANNKKVIASLYKFKKNMTITNFYKQCQNISLTKRYKDVIIANVTPMAVSDLGLSCVKVVALGGNSMIFNYKLEKPDFPMFLPIA